MVANGDGYVFNPIKTKLKFLQASYIKYIHCSLVVWCAFFPFSKAVGLENSKTPKSISFPSMGISVNLFDTFTFSKKTSPFVRQCTYLGAPIGMFLYGVYFWEWSLGKQDYFSIKPETFIGSRAPNGGADKCGHMFANYAGTRFLTFMFRATGSTKNKAIIQGALLNDVTSFIGEIGDGFSMNYGFDPYDVLFNQFGVLLGMVLEYFPSLSRVFSMTWEYMPSKRLLHNLAHATKWDISTDYDAAKFMLTTKLCGIPSLSLTPLKYLNVDVGYYTRGYKHPEEHPSRTRNIFLGISINYSIACEKVLPPGYCSSTLQSLFDYYHPWWDLEMKNWNISDIPHQ